LLIEKEAPRRRRGCGRCGRHAFWLSTLPITRCSPPPSPAACAHEIGTTRRQSAGYEAGRYISLERIIEGTKETYYEALLRSSQRWESGNHDLTPWHQYSLGVLVHAYGEFEERVGELAKMPGAKREAVLAAFEALDLFVPFFLPLLKIRESTVRICLSALQKPAQEVGFCCYGLLMCRNRAGLVCRDSLERVAGTTGQPLVFHVSGTRVCELGRFALAPSRF
jgi:hypothetical protein